MSEVATDVYDKLKSVSHGYARYEYEITNWRRSDFEKLNLLLKGGERIKQVGFVNPKKTFLRR